MGQNFSSEPVVEKETEREHNDTFNVAVSSCQGWRMSQEDNHSLMLDLPGEHKAAFFAVYDGHGSDKVSKHASEALWKHLTQNELYTQGNFKGALEQAFLTFDREVLASYNAQLAGTTAICMLIVDNVIYCANIGDSRAVAAVNCECIPLSYDHKPENPQELKRILAAGGYVLGNRVNGNLALSRAFGDFHYKGNDQLPPDQQIVSPCPDIKRIELNDEVDFIVLACDGIWDVLSSEEVVEFVISRLEQNLEPGLICEQLTTRCLATDYELVIGCDNMTVLLVCYTRGRSWEDYCTDIFDRNTKKLGVPRTRVYKDMDTMNQEIQESRLRSEASAYRKSNNELQDFTKDTPLTPPPTSASSLLSSLGSADATSSEARTNDRTNNMLQQAADDMRILLNVFSNRHPRVPTQHQHDSTTNVEDETPPITEIPADQVDSGASQIQDISSLLSDQNAINDKVEDDHRDQSSSDDDKLVETNSGVQQTAESIVQEIHLSSPDDDDEGGGGGGGDDGGDGENKSDTYTDDVQQELSNDKDDPEKADDANKPTDDSETETITNTVVVELPEQSEAINEEDISPDDLDGCLGGGGGEEKSDEDAAAAAQPSEPADDGGEDGGDANADSTEATDD